MGDNQSKAKRLLFSVTIADCDVQTFRAGGKGGQHQNKVESGVRVIHRASGAVGECRESRSQLDNKRTAFYRMAHTPEFLAWHKLEIAKRLGQESIVQRVDKLMDLGNLRVEVRNAGGRWEVAK